MSTANLITGKLSKRPTSFRIHLTFNKNDIGFEKIFSDLSQIKDHYEQIKHVKRLLGKIERGDNLAFDVNSLKPLNSSGAGSQRTKSIKIVFRISQRDIELENLIAEMSLCNSPSEHNQQVRRSLFSGYMKVRNRPALTTTGSFSYTSHQSFATTGTSATATLEGYSGRTGISAWAKMPTEEVIVLSEEELAARRRLKRKATLVMVV